MTICEKLPPISFSGIKCGIVMTTVLLLQVGVAYCATGVNGFSVGVLGNPKYFWGAKNGMIWRHNIQNSVATTHVVLDSGRCSAPCISPDGSRVAYFRVEAAAFDAANPYSGGYLWVMNSDGTNKKRLCATMGGVSDMLDFPGNSTIFEAAGGSVHKIDLSGTVVASYSVPTDPWQFEVANDLKKMIMRTSDFGGEARGSIVAYDLSVWPGTTYRDIGGGSGSSPSCGSSISSNGLYVCDGWIDHDGFDVRNWSNGSIVKSISNATACAWGPNTKNLGDHPSHLFWNSCGSTNSYKWRCISVNAHQVLINWVDNMCIVPTASFNVTFGWTDNSFDAGDFWVDTTTRTTTIQSEQKLSSELRTVNTKIRTDKSLVITVGLTEQYRLVVADIAGRTLWSGDGNKPAEFAIAKNRITAGLKIIKIQTEAGLTTQKIVVY